MPEPSTIRVVLVEDEPLLRDAIKNACRAAEKRAAQERQETGVESEQPYPEIVGEAGSAQQARNEIVRCSPQVVVLDLRIPEVERRAGPTSYEAGVRLLRDIASLDAETRPATLVLSHHDEPEIVSAALRAGAQGYFAKSDILDVDLLLDTIARIADGGIFYSPSVAPVVQRLLLSLTAAPQVEDALAELTPREHTILRLVALGLPNKEIGRRENITLPTVKSHVGNVLGKLGLTRGEVVARYADWARSSERMGR